MTKSFIGSLTDKNTDDVELLIEKCLPDIKSGFFSRPSEKILSDCLCSGYSLGAFDDNKMIGFRLTYFPDTSEENLIFDLPELEIAPDDVAQFHGTLVLASYQNTHIASKLIRENVKQLTGTRYKVILVTVHPENLYSCRMFQHSGFKIQKLVTKYGGLPRYIMSYGL